MDHSESAYIRTHGHGAKPLSGRDLFESCNLKAHATLSSTFETSAYSFLIDSGRTQPALNLWRHGSNISAIMSSSTVSVSVATPTRHPFERRVDEIKPSKTDINFVIMDYLINEGYPSAAKKFAMEANIQPPMEEESIQPRVEIRNAIHAGDIETAIHKINDLNPQILDLDPSLHFALLRLQLIELIRKCMASPNSDITPALTFASTQLAPRAPTNPEFLEDLERTMALLIFPPENLQPPLASLLDPALRQTVANRVNEAILASLGARREARLRNLVRLRNWAETKAREAGKEIPPKLSLGLEGDKAAEHDEDDAINGNGDVGDAMVS